MKTTLSTIVLLLFAKLCLAQDFWMQLEVPEDTGVYCIKGNTNGQTYLGARGFHISLDHGLNWNPTSFNELVGTIDINISNGDIFVGNHLGVFYSIDNGENWHPTSFNDNANIIFLSSNNNVFVGNWGGIYKSTDFGETWTQTLEMSNAKEVASIIETADGNMFAGITAWSVPGGGVYRSIDNGDSWEQSGLPNKYIRSLAVNSQGVIFAGSIGDHSQYYGGLYKSSDNGETWVELRNDVLVTSIVITPDDNIYFGSNEYGDKAGVFFSNDNGETWERIVSGLIGPSNQKIEGLSLAPDGYLYAYGNHLHRSVEPVFSSNSIHQTDVIQAIIYPNPFSENINIVLPHVFQDFSSVNIFIYDSLGKSVLKQKSNGKYNLGLNLSFLNPGFYYVVIEINGQQFTKSVIKQ